MAGTFILGETKVRPGTYFNIQKKGGNATAGVMNGVTAVIFRADFGPLNEAIELSAEDGYEGTFGLSLIHISEPTRLGMISYAVFCLKKKKKKN